jgi:hypothetical protein
VVQPDLAVICAREKLDDKGCRGAPDWINEVLSPATAAQDQIRKRDRYERQGVAECWLVHPTDRILLVYRLGLSGDGNPQILPLAGSTSRARCRGRLGQRRPPIGRESAERSGCLDPDLGRAAIVPKAPASLHQHPGLYLRSSVYG